MKFLTFKEVADRIENKENLKTVFVGLTPDVSEGTNYNDIPDIVLKPVTLRTVKDLVIKDNIFFIDISEGE